MIALKPEFHTLASQLLDHTGSWGVGPESFSWEGKGNPQIPVVASGGIGGDQVCRDVLAGSGAVDESVIREGQSGRSPEAHTCSSTGCLRTTIHR